MPINDLVGKSYTLVPKRLIILYHDYPPKTIENPFSMFTIIKLIYVTINEPPTITMAKINKTPYLSIVSELYGKQKTLNSPL